MARPHAATNGPLAENVRLLSAAPKLQPGISSVDDAGAHAAIPIYEIARARHDFLSRQPLSFMTFMA